MKVSIVGCGDSAKHWFKEPCDMSVGVNDCVKFGHEVDYLVVVNSPLKFFPTVKNNHQDRIKTIAKSKPKKFYSHSGNWKQYFPTQELISMRPFNGFYNPGRVYHTKTSPFVAITLAAKLGATEIIIWGVDMLTHHKFSAQAHQRHQGDFTTELGYYQMLFEALEKHGVKCYIGNENTVLKRYLPVYKSISSNSEVMVK